MLYAGRFAKETFSLDLRSLAIFRIGLGVMILVDLVCRSSDLIAHYCDTGVLPRNVLLQYSARPWHVSLHLMNGQPIVQVILFSFAGVLALFLILGYRTWWVTLLSWVMMVSLHARNPLVLNDGDIEFRILLFWSLFLPLGARWSVDDLLSPPANLDRPWQVVTAGTICYLFQIVMIYLFAALLKTGDSWLNGMAVNYAMELDLYGKPLRHVLTPYPDLMKFLTHFTYGLEKFGWLLLLIPFRQTWFRLLAIVLFVGMHLGFHLMMTLGIFSWVCMVAWIPFIPSIVWDRWLTPLSRCAKNFVANPARQVVAKIDRSWKLRARPIPIHLTGFGSVVAFLFLALVLVSNLQSTTELKPPDFIRSVTRFTVGENIFGISVATASKTIENPMRRMLVVNGTVFTKILRSRQRRSNCCTCPSRQNRMVLTKRQLRKRFGVIGIMRNFEVDSLLRIIATNLEHVIEKPWPKDSEASQPSHFRWQDQLFFALLDSGNDLDCKLF